jgi:hypothetical protein
MKSEQRIDFIYGSLNSGLIFAPKYIAYGQEDSLTDNQWRLFIIFEIFE